MAKIRKGIERLVSYVKAKPVRSLFAVGLAGLIGVTAAKDNVHFAFGSLSMDSPQETQYVWGVFPFVDISGDAGDVYTFGMVGAYNKLERKATAGDMHAGGLIFGVNNAGERATAGDMYAGGLIFGVNNAGERAAAGDMYAGSLISGVNNAGERAAAGDMYAGGLISGVNNAGEGAAGDMYAGSLLVGGNNADETAQISGDVESYGIISLNPSGCSIGSNVEEKKEKARQ